MSFRHFQKLLLTLVLACFLLLNVFPAWAQSNQAGLDVYFFYSQTCPHCARQKPLMKNIDQSNEDIDVHFIEVQQDAQTWQTFKAQHNITNDAVPRTFVENKSFIGYTESEGPLEYSPVYSGYIGYRNQIIQAIAQAVGHEIRLSATSESPTSHFSWVPLGLPLIYLISFPLLKRKLQRVQLLRYWVGGFAATCILSLFLFISLTPETVIKQFAQGLPFPLFVFAIALADGFNPCAFTVLIILLSLLTYTKRRRDMALVGGTFITTSAVMYFLFIMLMVAVGSVFLEQYGSLFMRVLGIGIAIAGLINIKDYFWFKQGVSLSLSEAQQLAITQKAGKIVRDLREPKGHQTKFFTALSGTVLLAIFVNIVELGCTAILPAVYMTTLVNYCSENSSSGKLLCYIFWTAVYALVYVIPLLLILSNFIYSFQSSRITETQGRRLKLAGGLFMLFFGLVMIFQPKLLVFA
jgi:glutaredoxin